MCSVAKKKSRVWLFASPWTVAHRAPLSMGFPRREYWSGLPFPSPGDLPHPGIEPVSPVSCNHRQILYRCITRETPLTGAMIKLKIKHITRGYLLPSENWFKLGSKQALPLHFSLSSLFSWSFSSLPMLCLSVLLCYHTHIS